MLRPASLAQQNALRLIVVFVAFEIIAALAVVWFLMMPLAWRSADDFAGLLTLSAETWGELPPITRPAFERHLAEVHGIELQVAPPPDAREREGRDEQVLMGLNCRNLETLEIDFERFARLRGRMPLDWPCVAESGVQTPADAARVAALGYRLALVGTGLMRRADPARALGELLEAGRKALP